MRSSPPSGRPPGPDWFLRARLKLRHLSLLIALDQQRNLHRAATLLNLSQPAASKMLGEMERALGVQLFDRLPRGVEPTWYGEVLIRHARTILSELAHAGDELGALMLGHGGSVAVGAVTAPAVEAVAATVQATRRDHPNLRISVESDTSDVLIARLLEAKIDFAVARIPRTVDASAFDYEEVGEEEVVILARDGHPLTTGAVGPAALVRVPWVLQPTGSLLRATVDAFLRRNGLPPPADVVETGSVLIALAMIARTDAVTALARPVADLLCSPGRFRVVALRERLAVEPFGLVSLRGRPFSPAAAMLFAAVRKSLLAPAPEALPRVAPEDVLAT